MNCKEIGKIVGQGTGDVKEHLDHHSHAFGHCRVSLTDEIFFKR